MKTNKSILKLLLTAGLLVLTLCSVACATRYKVNFIVDGEKFLSKNIAEGKTVSIAF